MPTLQEAVTLDVLIETIKTNIRTNTSTERLLSTIDFIIHESPEGNARPSPNLFKAADKEKIERILYHTYKLLVSINPKDTKIRGILYSIIKKSLLITPEEKNEKIRTAYAHYYEPYLFDISPFINLNDLLDEVTELELFEQYFKTIKEKHYPIEQMEVIEPPTKEKLFCNIL